MENASRVHFSLPTAAGRSVGGENLVFSYEEIRNGLVKRVGPAMVLCSGMGNLSLAFDFPGEAPLPGDPIFRDFARKLIRSIPSPFYFLSLESDLLKLLFLCTLENLEIEWRTGEIHSHISADSEEYATLFTDEASRLRTVLTASGGMDHYEPRIRQLGEYFAR